MKKVLSIVLCITVLLTIFCGCEKNDNSENDTTTTTTTTTTTQASSEVDNSFSNRDSESTYDESSAVKISLNGSSATATSKTVKISGSTVTITENVTHIISGTLNNGMIIVDTPDTSKLQLVLNGVDITSETSAAIYVKEADKVFVTLIGENSLSNGGVFNAIDENSIDGAIYSKQDITFNGSGTLTISSPAGHGIVGKDDVVFTGGKYNITSASHGIDANDSVKIKNTEISADTGKDGIHAENNDDSSKGYIYIESGMLKIESEGDGISAGNYLQIAGGTIDILAGGGYENGSNQSSSGWGDFGGGGGMFGGGQKPGPRSADGTVGTTALATTTDDSTSMKGIKSGANLVIDGGTITVDSADDTIHSNTSVIINNGTFTLASGDDGIHAEEKLTVNNGTINISNSYEGLEALEIYINGGKIKLKASDDGFNAAGGTDSSGTTGGRDGMFGGGGMMGGGMSSNSNGKIVIADGDVYINASGDGIDANGTIEISGGYTVVVGPTQGDTATLDYDKTATITGGTFIGTGASNMAQTFSDSKQGVFAVSVGNQSAGTKITLTNKKGKEVIAYEPELSFQVVIISCPELVSGETYTIKVGSTSGSFEAT